MLNPYSDKVFTLRQLTDLLRNSDQYLMVDTRNISVFTEGFIPGSLFIGIDKQFTEWAINLLPADKQLILIAATGKEESCVSLLSDAGVKNIAGYLEGGFEAWKDAGRTIDMVINVDAGELAMDIPFDENLLIVDVRHPVEFAGGHIQDAINIPLNDMKDPGIIAQLNERDNIYLHSSSGYRSVIAASLLKIQGYNNLRNVTGGWESIKHTKGITVVKEPGALN